MVQKLDARALALSFGLCWGGAMLLVGWAATVGWGVKFVEVMGSIYIGFEPSLTGALVGGIWGFVDGMLGGLIVALLYNLFVRKV